MDSGSPIFFKNAKLHISTIILSSLGIIETKELHFDFIKFCNKLTSLIMSIKSIPKFILRNIESSGCFISTLFKNAYRLLKFSGISFLSKNFISLLIKIESLSNGVSA